MEIKKLKEGIARVLAPHVFDELKTLEHNYSLLANKAEEQIEKIETQKEVISQTEKQLIQLKEDSQKTDTTELEKFCSKNYTEVPKFAYKEKGLFKDELFPMYPNELIQPDVFLVKQLRSEVGKKLKDTKDWALRIAEFTDKKKKWTSDKDTDNLLDLYQDIYASILDPKLDCENHASIVSSIEPEFGIAFGFAGKTGHAWNVFVYNNQLWCIETNSTKDYNRNYRVFQYSRQKTYKIHYIFTKDKTFKTINTPANFGRKIS